MTAEHDRVGAALDLLTAGVTPFFIEQLQSAFGERWEEQAQQSLRSERVTVTTDGSLHWDAYSMLVVMWDQWNQAFRGRLGLSERSLVGELREVRNRWAHQAVFDEDDAYRALDSVQRLLRAVGNTALAAEAERLKLDALREKFGKKFNRDQARSRFNRDRVRDVLLYATCGIAIIGTTLLLFGRQHYWPAGLLSAFVTFAFTFFIWQRLVSNPPLYGVHECVRCRKIVYTEVCPYCEPSHQRS